MLIKVFRFVTSNWTDQYDETTIKNRPRPIQNEYFAAKRRLDSIEKIEETVGSFCSGKRILSMKTTSSWSHDRNSDGPQRCAELIYTITYDFVPQREPQNNKQ